MDKSNWWFLSIDGNTFLNKICSLRKFLRMLRESSRNEQRKVLIGICDMQQFPILTEVALCHFLRNEGRDSDRGIKQVDLTEDKGVRITRQIGEKPQILKYNGKGVPSIQFGLKYCPPKCTELSLYSVL